MYSDLFDHLGSSGASGGAGSGGRGSGNDSNDKSLVSFKAGKCDMNLQENGKYWITPDTRRGEIRITWKNSDNALYWEWYDRREKMVSDRYILTPPSSSTNTTGAGTLERVMDCPNIKDADRILLWTRPKDSGSSSNSSSPDFHMYWMQDASDEKDDEFIAKVNQYLADPASANPAASSSGDGGGDNANASGSGGTGTGSGDATSTTSSERQVDALSNILENLGMPQSDNASAATAGSSSGAAGTTSGSGTTNSNSTGGAAPSGSATAGATAGTLTLADLQGAMASLQQNSATANPMAVAAAAASGPPLTELVTPEAINSILSNEEVSNKLLDLLPENQRSREYLEENLRSPQVQQTLRTLTTALLPDDTGSLEGFHSVLANFQLPGGNEAMIANHHNPILAFLECIQKKVDSEKKEGGDDKKDGEGEDSKEEEKK